MNMAFHEYLKVFMKLILDDFSVFSDLKTHMLNFTCVFSNIKSLVLMHVFGLLKGHTWVCCLQGRKIT
jgi:hypothetical protein